MVEYFKEGYYYKWIGDKDYFWWSEDSKLISDNKWHKCIYSNEYDKRYAYAQFEGLKESYTYEKENFIETKYPPRLKIKKLLKETK